MAFERGDVGKLTDFFDQLEAECKKFDPDFISLDPVADLFGGNENSRVHVRQFVGSCFGTLIRECPRPATGLLIAHPSSSGMSSGSGTSGSSDWNNAVRSRLYFEQVKAEDGEAPDEDARYLWRKKSNHARPGDRILLRWRDGVFELAPGVSAMDPGFLGSRERERCDHVFLDLLKKCIAQRGYVSDARSSDKYAPDLFVKREDRAGFKRQDFERTMVRLFEAGRIRQSTYTTPSRNVRGCIVPVTDDEPVTGSEPSP
jgi:RecA-family ATPase